MNDIFRTVFSSAFIQLANLTAGILAARMLMPDGRGVLALLILWPTLLAHTASLSLGDAAIYLAAGGRADPRQITVAGSWLAVVLSSLAVVVGIPLLSLVLGGIGSSIGETPWFVLVLIPLTVCGTFWLDAVRSRGSLEAFAWLRSVQAPFYLLGLAVAASFDLAGAESFAGAFVLATGLAAVSSGVWLARSGSLRLVAPESAVLRQLLSFGAKVHPGFLLQLINARADQILIGVLLPPSSLGIYVVAMSLVMGVLELSRSVSLVAYPRIAGLETADVLRSAGRYLRLTIGGVGIAAVVLWLVAYDVVVLLFGVEFAEAATILRILLAGIVPHATREVFMAIFKAQGRPALIGKAELVSMAVAVLGFSALMPWAGIAGASWVYVLTQWSISGWMLWRCSRSLRLPLPLLLGLRPSGGLSSRHR
jgi:O-antigen/teichoic acid export membrane protein